MPLITAAGDGNAGAPPTWVGGVIPADGDTVDLLGFTVTVEAGHTTNRWDGLVATNGTLVVVGGWVYRGILLFDDGDTLDLRPTADLQADCTVDNQANVYPYINGGTLLTSRSAASAPRIHATDDAKRPTYGIRVARCPDAAPSSIDGLEVFDCNVQGLSLEEPQSLVIENVWAHDCQSYGIRLSNSGPFQAKNICVYGCGAYGIGAYRATFLVTNLLCGEDLDGNADPNGAADIYIDNGRVVGNAVLLSSATAVFLANRSAMLRIANFGALVTDGIITGQGTPGDTKDLQYEGTIDRDGTVCTMTPNSNCSATFPLRANLSGPPPHCTNIPVSADDAVAPSLKAHAIGAALECELWGSGLTLTAEASEIKDCALAETTFSWTGAVRSGGTDRQLPWEFRVREYQIGASIHLNSAHVLVGATTWWGLDLDRWLLMRSADPAMVGPHRLYLTAIQRAIHEHLLGCPTLTGLVPGGIHDGMAPPKPHAGDEVYPYLIHMVFTDDASPFSTSVHEITCQVDIYDRGTSGVVIGECSKALNERLDRRLITDLYAQYHPFSLQAETARRLKEAPDIWRISQDFTGFVQRI